MDTKVSSSSSSSNSSKLCDLMLQRYYPVVDSLCRSNRCLSVDTKVGRSSSHGSSSSSRSALCALVQQFVLRQQVPQRGHKGGQQQEQKEQQL
jgi:hypothetical protein